MLKAPFRVSIKIPTLTRCVSLMLLISMVHAPQVCAQSDLDIIQAMASRDIAKVKLCLRRTDPNMLYSGKTALMRALEMFEESLKNSAQQNSESSVIKNGWQFVSGTSLFSGGLGVTGLSGLLFWNMKNDPEVVPAQERPLLSQVPIPEVPIITISQAALPSPTESISPRDSTTLSRPETPTSHVRPRRSWASWGLGLVGFSPPADSLVTGQPQVGSDGEQAEEPASTISTLIPQATLKEVHKTVEDSRKLINDSRTLARDINALVKIITISVLVGTSISGVVAMAYGVPRATQGLVNTMTRPFQRMYQAYEISVLKNIVYLLLRQEHIDLSVQSDSGETVLELVQRLMLDHIQDRDVYQQLSEIEQLIKVRQTVS